MCGVCVHTVKTECGRYGVGVGMCMCVWIVVVRLLVVMVFPPRCKVNENTEGILFREKFTDWPEPNRIIKMKGHISSGEVMVR